MLLFELKEKARHIPWHTKLWMYPIAYLLSGIAVSVVWAVDLFNAVTLRKLVQN